MNKINRVALAAMALLGSAAVAGAQTTQDHTVHHPDTPAPGAAAAAPPPAGAPAMPAMDMSKMMGGDMMQMMAMMPEMMRMMRGAMMQQAMRSGDGMGAGMGMGMMQLDRVEGRIAFLKAELAITEAQLPQWNSFADALRNGAKGMRATMAMMSKDGMPNAGMPQAGAPAAAPESMEMMVGMMSARLDNMKSVLAAVKPLYGVLSDAQKKTANELLGAHPMAGRAKRMGD